MFDGEGSVETFFMKYEEIVVEPHRLLALDISLQATPARWWTAHKVLISSWEQCRRLTMVRFGAFAESFTEYYSELTDPREHILTCGYRWNEVPREVWTHMFVHTLDVIRKKWYVQLELCRETVSWEEMTSSFVHTFNAYESDLMMDTTLHLYREKIFEGIEESEGSLPDWTQFTEQSMECYKLEESKSEDMEPREVHIPEIEGEREVVGLEISCSFSEPLKTVKVNIGTEEVP